MIVVLRLGHRKERDARISTHVGLVARAFGAQQIVFSGERDEKLLESVKKVSKRWGGPFKVGYDPNWKKVIKAHKKKGFTVIHMTMYGLPLQSVSRKVRKKKNILIIVGAEKVPPEAYSLADFNIAVTNQPHSEVAALAILLHAYFGGKELGKKFKAAKIKIVPQAKGKKVAEK